MNAYSFSKAPTRGLACELCPFIPLICTRRSQCQIPKLRTDAIPTFAQQLRFMVYPSLISSNAAKRMARSAMPSLLCIRYMRCCGPLGRFHALPLKCKCLSSHSRCIRSPDHLLNDPFNTLRQLMSRSKSSAQGSQQHPCFSSPSCSLLQRCPESYQAQSHHSSVWHQ